METNENIRRRYDRVSKVYDILEQPMEMMSVENVQKSGFTGVEVVNLTGDIVKKIVFKNKK